MQYGPRVSLLVDHVSHNLCRKYGVDMSVRRVVVQARFEFTDSRHSFRRLFLFQANQRLWLVNDQNKGFSPVSVNLAHRLGLHTVYSRHCPPGFRRQLLHAARCRSR
jgi:hypothetical protein